MDLTVEIRVLHVDDSAPLRDLTAEFLERVDDRITVRSEADPTAVLGHLRADEIDCVVSDYEMPELDGIELCRQVRTEYPDLPFFLFTNREDEEIVDRAMAAGATDYLRKESGLVQYKLLAHRIGNAVRHRRTRRRLAELEESYGES